MKYAIVVPDLDPLSFSERIVAEFNTYPYKIAEMIDGKCEMKEGYFLLFVPLEKFQKLLTIIEEEGGNVSTLKKEWRNLKTVEKDNKKGKILTVI
jgi:hypothetical protein